MHFEILGINNNDQVDKRMDKKHKVLNKYYAEVCRDMNRERLTNNYDQENETCGSMESSKRLSGLHFHSNNLLSQQEYINGAKRKEYLRDDDQESYSFPRTLALKSESSDFHHEDLKSDSHLNSNYITPDDCTPSLDALKIEPEANDYSYNISEPLSFNSELRDNVRYYSTYEPAEYRNSTHDLYGNSVHESSNWRKALPSSDSNYYRAAANGEDPSLQELIYPSPSEFYLPEEHWMDEEEEPLDLSVPKEDEQNDDFNTYDYVGNYQENSPREERSEENSWLKKIKTGTRSRVRSPKSWEFLLRLLMDPRSNPSMIKWEDEKSGTFRLVQKDEIAKIWGMRSIKHKDGGLSYDNFARNLRYHYKTKMLVPVSEKHLVYRFSSEVMDKRYSIVQ